MKRSSTDTSTLTSDDQRQLPSILFYQNIKRLSCVKFERYLMLIEGALEITINKKEKPEGQTPIPKFIAYLVLVIRDKFEKELKNRTCFLECETFPNQRSIVKLAKLLYFNSENFQDVFKITIDCNCLLLFCTLLEFLNRFEYKLLQFSQETSEFVNKESIFVACRPNDFIIVDQLTNYLTNTYLKKRSDAQNKKKNENLPILNNLGKIVQSYYAIKNYNKTEDVEFLNKFYKFLYRDFRQTKTTMHRYLFRFILRNCLYIIRRYVYVVGNRIRLLRKECWATANQTVIPNVSTFAIHRMAKFLACTIMEIKGSNNSLKDRVLLLENVFTIESEALFYRQKKFDDIMINTDPTYCHSGCVCGMG